MKLVLKGGMPYELSKRGFVLSKTLQTHREYTLIFTTLFVGTLGVVIVSLSLLLISYFVLHNTYVLGRIVIVLLAVLYLVAIYWAWHKKRRRAANHLLIYFYGVIAAYITLSWGINVPFGILFLAIVIILSGILFGSQYTLLSAFLVIFFISSLQLLITLGIYAPIASADLKPSQLGDVLAYDFLFAVLALISWLFGRQTERAEASLLQEKQLLEIRVEERTRALEAAQFKEIQQLYRFVEVGQLSAALIHDLANTLNVLTFDIEDLSHKQHSATIKRARQSIRHLEKTIKQVRKQLEGKGERKHFDIIDSIKECIQLLSQKAVDADVEIVLKTRFKRLGCIGDPTRLNHVLAILIANSIDAYKDNPRTHARRIEVRVKQQDTGVVISVEDWGNGIISTERPRLFQPFYSTKKSGMGIGLFIAKQMIETHFKGSLVLIDSTDSTCFTLTLPKKS